ncbi:ABC transporter permease [uncultured Jatrophihabitans sp.]|uniref:ABC transporter permease n=1 Tax=uncultured Jatrophihabitans sp. TaxID=1610747 RepID=UPI0035CB225F
MDVSQRIRPHGSAVALSESESAALPASGAEPVGRRRAFGGNILLIIFGVDVVFVLLSQFALGTHLLGRSSLSTVTPVLGVLVLVSLAQGIVIGTGGIDLSIPATVTLVGTIVLKASNGANSGIGTAMVTALVACVVIGLVNGLLVEAFRLNALVVTLATGQLIGGVTRLYRGPVPSVSNVPPAVADFASHSWGGVSLILFLALALVAVLWLVLNQTVPGRVLVASSASTRAATLAGLRARTYRIAAWVLATVVCGFAAVLLSGQIGSPDLTLGDPYLLSTVVAVVLGGAILSGGRVSPVGIALGAVFISVLNQDLQVRGYSTGVAQIAQGAVLGVGLALLGWVRSRRGAPPLMRLRRRNDAAAGKTA